MHLFTVLRFTVRAEANTPSTKLRAVAHRRTRTETHTQLRNSDFRTLARGSLIIQSVYSFIKYTTNTYLLPDSQARNVHI